MDQLSAIVLAAGSSSRMGSSKALLDLEGNTLLAWAVRAFTAVGVPDVVVVTGHRAEEVAAVAERAGARAVTNPRHQEGMYSSVQVGAAAIPEGRRFFLLPVDCPLVRPESVGRMARVGAATGAAVVLPVHGGRTGHPPLLAPGLRAEILAARPAGGLHEVLSASPERIVRLDLDDPGVLYDADTPAELEALRLAAPRGLLPSRERCLEILAGQGAEPGLVDHCVAVAAVAAALTAALNARSQHLCPPLVEAGALLHDVARAVPSHADAGADLLARLGYERLAPLVRRHMRLDDDDGGLLDEAQVVYLADKLVLGDRVVSLEERFADRLERAARDETVRAAVAARLQEARLVQARVEAVLEGPLGDVVAGRRSSGGA